MYELNQNIFGTENVVTVNEIEVVMDKIVGLKNILKKEPMDIIKSLKTCRKEGRVYKADSYDFFHEYLLKNEKTKDWMKRNNKGDYLEFFREIAEWYERTHIKEMNRSW